MLKRAADINAKSQVGWTALHNAAESGHLNIVKMLVDSGADYYSSNRSKNTPLDLAKLNEHKEIVDYLENLMNQEQQEQIEINQDPDTQIQL